MIYRKALRLSPAARQQQSTGMIVNMFSNDTKQLQNFLYFFNNVVIAPFQIVACIVLIYMQVGPATFVGVGLMIISIPLNLFIFLTLNQVRQKKVKKTDIRVKLMNEILSGIRVIKYYAWEHAFQKNITAVRLEELLLLKKMAYIVAFGFTSILFLLPLVQPILIFYTYVKLGNQLTSAIAFTTIAYFNMLQFPFAFLPMGLSQYSQSLVSTKRMLNFFVSEELDPYVTNAERDDNIAIETQNLSICWIKESAAAEYPPTAVTELLSLNSDTATTTANIAANNKNDNQPNLHDSNLKQSESEHNTTNASNANGSINAVAEEEKDVDNGMSSTVLSPPVVSYQRLKSSPGVDNDDDDNNNKTAAAATAVTAVAVGTTNTSNHHHHPPHQSDLNNNNNSSSSKSLLSLATSINNRSYHTLKDISISIKKGSLVAVVGAYNFIWSSCCYNFYF
jgi:ABC-type multidrug transport system fused ATPase/permease subunit